MKQNFSNEIFVSDLFQIWGLDIVGGFILFILILYWRSTLNDGRARIILCLLAFIVIVFRCVSYVVYYFSGEVYCQLASLKTKNIIEYTYQCHLAKDWGNIYVIVIGFIILFAIAFFFARKAWKKYP